MTNKFIRRLFAVTASAALALACQNGNQAVDLGLSVLWADHNLGAGSETGFGWYLAWGEMQEKDHYFYDNYRYTESEADQSTADIGADICGTEYDMAAALWGEGWRLPSEAEMAELIEKCNWSWEIRDGVTGAKIVGPNGNAIFLPAGGTNKEIPDNDDECAYWTGTLSQGLGRTAVSLLCFHDSREDKTTLRTFGTYKVYGLLVRPVRDPDRIR